MALNFSLRFNKRDVEILGRKVKQVRGRNKVLQKIADEEVQNAKTRIRRTKTGPDGRPWAPWKNSTLRQRQYRGTASRGLLFDTGRLHRSIDSRVTKDKVEITTDTNYGRFLQRGTRDMPPRPFLGWSRRSVSDVRKGFLDFFRRIFR